MQSGGLVPSSCVLAIAGFVRYMSGIDEGGEEIALQDPLRNVLQPLAKASLDNVAGSSASEHAVDRFITAVFGDEVCRWDAFVDRVKKAYKDLRQNGCRRALAAVQKLSKKLEDA